ncbi:unnamed protein product [Chironomus riparius]|uniref:Peptidase C1A papain C-terminal domain-containing protein n=1 Tax=Chironomus riparius TaxID=315576 RepID=A0A9N9S1B1_9DIPT|nr:unnamed protein product [Chironomus riparius]
MKVIVILMFVNCVNPQITFNKWKQALSGIVNTYSLFLDQQVFDMNCAFINAFNSKFGQSFQLGLNEFSSLTFSQFQTKYLGIMVPSQSNRISQIVYSNSGLFARFIEPIDIIPVSKTIPASIDYRNSSLAVQNQKNCGSCWAFTALSILGGWPINALNWILKSGGNAAPAMANYQYYGFKTKCRTNLAKIPVNIKAVVQNYTAGNENMMKEIVANVGPVAAVISVTSVFQLYKSGIFYDTTCNSNCGYVNHAVVIVGYGRNATTNLDYWIVKNTWGTTWGQLGYIYMSRNRGNNCNIACYAIHLGLVVPKTADRISSTTYSETMHSPLMSIMPTTDSSSTTVADSVDYSNYTLAVKHQLNCGSCWAFSVLDTLESRLKRLNNSYNTKLSPQYLVDCDTRDYACGGGWPINALNWIVQGGGNAVPAWTDYQYYGFKLRCRVTPKIHMGIVATVQNFTGGNENMMKELVSNYGPLTSVISVTSYFQLYKSGIFYDTTCNSNCATVNHAIVIVGYGRNVTTNMDYWIVKNSWVTNSFLN